MYYTLAFWFYSVFGVFYLGQMNLPIPRFPDSICHGTCLSTIAKFPVFETKTIPFCFDIKLLIQLYTISIFVNANQFTIDLVVDDFAL